MEEVHNFHEGFLGFVLSRHIGEGLARLGFHVDAGTAFAKRHHITHPGLQLPGEQAAQSDDDQGGDDQAEQVS